MTADAQFNPVMNLRLTLDEMGVYSLTEQEEEL